MPNRAPDESAKFSGKITERGRANQTDQRTSKMISTQHTVSTEALRWISLRVLRDLRGTTSYFLMTFSSGAERD